MYIEYAPLEKAWTPIKGDNYYYIYCLWVSKDQQGKGYGKELIQYCILDAQRNGKSGICMLGATKQKAWLSDQSFVRKYGFKVVDTTKDGYELLALSFDGTKPKFPEKVKTGEIETEVLTIYYDWQCPYIFQFIDKLKNYCEGESIPMNLILIDSLEKAKELPCVFNNWAVLYKGQFRTVNLLDVEGLKRILNK